MSRLSKDDPDSISHIFKFIRRDVDEDLLAQLFTGNVDSSSFSAITKPCGIVLHPNRAPDDAVCGEYSSNAQHPSVAKLMGECLVYPHLKDGELLDGTLENFPCKATLTIYVPEDDKRAIIIPGPEPHSHPAFSCAKLTHTAEKDYLELVEASKSRRATVLSVDRGTWRLLY